MDKATQSPTVGRRHSTGFVLAVVVAVFVLATAACSSDTDDASANATASPATRSVQASTTPTSADVATTDVVVQNLKFSPVSLTITTGQRVTWRFADGTTAHNVRFGSTTSPTLTTGTWTYRFTAPGTYQYLCTLHPFMTGSITVT